MEVHKRKNKSYYEDSAKHGDGINSDIEKELDEVVIGYFFKYETLNKIAESMK